MSVDISVSITEDIVDIIATPTVNIVNVTNSASIDPSLYDLSEFTNTSPNPFVRTSGLSSYVPTSRTLTINGVTQDLSADRTFTIATGLTVGTTPIASGTIGRVLFQGTGNVLQQSSSLFWDSTNNRLGIGTSSPTTIVHINGNAAGSEPSLQIRQQANTTPTWFAVRNTDNLAATGAVSLDLGISGGTGQFFTGTAQGDIVLKAYSNPSTSKFFLGTGNTAQMVLFPSTNNIGINTTTDAGFRLDVNGTARVQDLLDVAGTNGRLIFRSPELGTRLNGVHWANPTNTGSYGYLSLSGSSGEFRMFASSSYFPTFYSNGSERMRIASTGNLLINTTTDAGFRLDVNGTARFSSQLSVSNAQGIQFTNGFSGLSGNCIYSQGSATLLFINRNQVTANFYNGGADTTQCIQFGNGIGVTQPANSACALFDLVSTTKGFLPPRLTTAQKNAIVSPVAGLVVYDTTLNLLQFYNGTIWI
jgi:hypothetical protein